MLKKAGRHIEGQESSRSHLIPQTPGHPGDGAHIHTGTTNLLEAKAVGFKLWLFSVGLKGPKRGILPRLDTLKVTGCDSARGAERVYVAAYGAPDRAARHTDKHTHTPSKHHLQTGTHAADVSVTE